MTSLTRLPKGDPGADIPSSGHARGGHKGIVEGIERQCWDCNPAHVRFCRGASPVILGVFEAMERRGEDVVKSVEVAGGQQCFAAKEMRVLCPFLQGLGHHRGEEHARVCLSVEPFANGLAAGGQV